MLDLVILFLEVSLHFCDSKTIVLLSKVAFLQCLEVVSFIPKQLVLLFKQISLDAKSCIFYCAPYVCKSEKMVSVSSIYVSYFQNSDA